MASAADKQFGPLAIFTDVIAARGCTSPMMVFAGKADSRKEIAVPANGAFTLTSAETPIAEDERLEVAMLADGAPSASCGVTWVARRR